MSKLSLLTAGAAGYVLGARAGRQRYDQIAAAAQKFMGNPRVQAAKQQAQDAAKQQAAAAGAVVAEKAKETASAAADKVRSSDSAGPQAESNGWPADSRATQ